jgi:large subunit ribosomal protein L24
MAKFSLRAKDEVIVLKGKEAGKKGKILRVLPAMGKVLVEKVNLVKKHMRPTKKLPHGGIIEKESPIAISNVMLVCPKCSKPTRVGKKLLEDGSRVRICKKCGEVIDK